MPIIYLAHCYSGDPANLILAKQWLRWTNRYAALRNAREPSPFIDGDLHIVAPWIPLCEVSENESCPEITRRHGLRQALALFTMLQGRAFEVWAFNKIGLGSMFECNAALHCGGTAWDMTYLGATPPDELFDPRESHEAKVWSELTPEWWRIVEE